MCYCRISFIPFHTLYTFKAMPLDINSALGDKRHLFYMLPVPKYHSQNKPERWSGRPTPMNISVPRGKARTPLSDQLLAQPCSLGQSHKLLPLSLLENLPTPFIFHKDPMHYITPLKLIKTNYRWFGLTGNSVIFPSKLKKALHRKHP